MRPNVIKSGLIAASLVFSLNAHAAGMGAAASGSAPRMEGAAAARGAATTGLPGTAGGISSPTTPATNESMNAANPGVGTGSNSTLNTGATANLATGAGSSSPSGSAGPGNVPTNCSAPYAPAGCASKP